jgi:hypothetical protein
MSDQSDTEQIDHIIANESGWKRDVLIALRHWVKGELNGYRAVESLPKYRTTRSLQ